GVALAVGEGRRQPGADVLDPPQVLDEGEPEEAPVEVGVVVDLEGALAPEVERLVAGDGAPLPAELQLQRAVLAHRLPPSTHASAGSAETMPCSVIVRTSTHTRPLDSSASGGSSTGWLSPTLLPSVRTHE